MAEESKTEPSATPTDDERAPKWARKTLIYTCLGLVLLGFVFSVSWQGTRTWVATQFEAPQPIPPVPPPTILLGCNGGEQEMPMPLGGVVYRLGPKCTSGWVIVPDKMPDGRWAPGFRTEPERLVLVRRSFGKISPETGEPIAEEEVFLSAFAKTNFTKRAKAMQFKNKNDVQVAIYIHPV